MSSGATPLPCRDRYQGMKALSLRQPWAWLVTHGGKDIENRRWATRYRGPFFVHAAKGMTLAEYEDAVRFVVRVAGVDLARHMPDPEQLERGGIVGRASLVDVIPPCLTFPCAHPWHMEKQHGFVLEGAEPLPFRPLGGALGFFAVEGRTR